MPRMQMSFKGLDEYIDFLSTLTDHTENAMRSALYAGAKVIADEVRSQIQAIPAVTEAANRAAFKNDDVKYRMSEAQKAGLLQGLGVARHELAAASVNTVVGFDGYNDVQTEQYPGGQPNQLVARIYEHGTSYSAKQPFMRKAKNASKAKAEAVMIQRAEQYMEAVRRSKGV